MGCDYALVHLYYTIPPAIALTVLYRPFCSPLDVYKILFLVFIAVAATIPWDSYLIHTSVWTYPPNAIIGPTLFKIPAEEVFFFVVQTYTTSLLYLLLGKPTFHPQHLQGTQRQAQSSGRTWQLLGTSALAVTLVAGMQMVEKGREGLYMGLILVWAVPFVLLLWNLAYQFIINLPLSNTLLPVILPTAYLWVVDTLALQRGTWVIESDTKLGWYLWDGLEVEEAVFFLMTNVLIVLGLVAFDNAIAIIQSFPLLFPLAPSLPSPSLLVRALLLPVSSYDDIRIEGLRDAITRLRQKSRSFYLASGVFQGRLRIDLVLLYSFCRVADDLVDHAQTTEEAQHWIQELKRYLDFAYRTQNLVEFASLSEFITATFPPFAQSALILLPTSYLSPTPFYGLLKGFEIDLCFSSSANRFPITDEEMLQVYGACVAGTVAETCIELVYHHTTSIPDVDKHRIIQAGGRMGIALQYVNISRDIAVDARMGRVYIPTDWLKQEQLLPTDILDNPDNPKVESFRGKLLDRAMGIYAEARSAIDLLPVEARGPMKVAVENYMEIGRTLRKPKYRVKAGRATVPKWRRLQVTWKALTQ